MVRYEDLDARDIIAIELMAVMCKNGGDGHTLANLAYEKAAAFLRVREAILETEDEEREAERNRQFGDIDTPTHQFWQGQVGHPR
jgi:hypothetical protein